MALPCFYEASCLSERLKMKTKFEIKSYLGSLLFTYEGDSLKDAVVAAVKSGANLSGANLYMADLSGANLSGANLYMANLSGANLYMADLSGANLSGANLYMADLSGANLSGADLSRANLSGANLYMADLSGANLSGADLSRANLYRANLSGADLSGANLSGADLSRANLYRANLSGADLSGANLSGANLSRANLYMADLSGADLSGANLYRADLKEVKNSEYALAQTLHVPSEGPFWGWKKCGNGVLVQVAIGTKAKRSNGAGRKCRAEYVKVLAVEGAEFGVSMHDGKTEYRVGQIVRCDKWDDNRWNECSGGIHFFITKEEAKSFTL